MKVLLRMVLIGCLLGLGGLTTWSGRASDPRPKPKQASDFELAAVALSPFPDQPEEAIDPRSGRLVLTARDVVVGTGPVTLEVERAWQAVPTAPGLLGTRWRLNWESRLVRAGDQVRIDDWHGSLAFTPDRSRNTYQGPPGDRLAIESDRAVRTLADGSRETFDASGRLIERLFSTGHKADLTYDDQGCLLRIAGPCGSWLRLTCNAQGRLIRIDASTGAVVRYAYGREQLVPTPEAHELMLGYGYDETGALVHIDHPQRGRTSFRYAGGRIVGRRWADGGQEEFAYDPAGRCRRHVDAAGWITTIVWDNDGRTQVIDAGGHKSVVESDSAGRPVRVTGPTGESARIAYDHLGRTVSVHNSLQGTTRIDYQGDTQLPLRVAGADGTKQSFGYDARQNLISITEGDTVAATFAYDAGGLVTQLKTGQGLDLAFTYDEQGRRQSVTNAAGKTTRFEYDRQGRLVREINPVGGIIQCAYDAAGRLIRRTDPAGGATRFEYALNGLLSRRTEPAGGVTRYEYDARGRLTVETDPDGHSRRFEYGPDGGLRCMADGAGVIGKFEYDQDGHLARWTNPLGGVTRADHDPLGRLTRLTGAGGGTTGYEHSPAGLVTSRTDPAGTVTRYDHDSRGRLTSITNPAGQVTRFEYGPHGRLARVIPARGPVTAYEYNPAGKVVRVVGRQGVLVGYEYDVLGRRVKEQHAAGRVVSYRYDDLGNLLAWSDSLGGGGSLKYDPAGRPISFTDGSGAATHYRYDPAGRLLDVKDPRGYSKRLEYTPAGRLAGVCEPTGDKSRLEYDGAGGLETLHHAGGGITRLARDAMGNPLRVTNPLGQETHRTYDVAGRMLSVTDARGQTTSFAYDPAGRLVEKRTADGSSVSYRYDAQGNRTAVDDGKFPVLFAYGKNNQLIGVEYPAIKRTLRYEYDDAGRRTKLVDSEGRTVGYEYDATGRLSAITLAPLPLPSSPAGGEGKAGKVAVFAYDAKDRLTSLTYANGVQGAWEYDANNRPRRLTYASTDGQVIAGWFYSYDTAGNCIKTVDLSGSAARYEYDPAGQLLEEDHGDGKGVKYRYLAGGNRGQREGRAETDSYRYDEADRLLAAGQQTFSHDANGNLVERRGPQGVTRYHYDAEDRLIKVILPGGAEVTYGYAPTGQRVWKRDTKGLTYFVHDGLSLTAELDQDLKPRATYLHGAGIDQPLMMDQAGRVFYYHAGRLGSIYQLTDGKGQTVAAYDYDAFGNVSRQEGSVANPFGYTARELDQETGLYYYRARYYDARLGRFLAADPMPPRLVQPLTANPYLYVRNNPVNLIDPLGLADEDWEQVWRFFGDDVNMWDRWPPESPEVIRQKIELIADEMRRLQTATEFEARQGDVRRWGTRRYALPGENLSHNDATLTALERELTRLRNNLPPQPNSTGQGSPSGSQGPAGTGTLPPRSNSPEPVGIGTVGEGPNRPAPPPPSNMPASNWVDEGTPTYTNGPRLSGREGGPGESASGEGGGPGSSFLEEHGGKLGVGIIVADTIARAARGEDPAEILKAEVLNAVLLQGLRVVPNPVATGLLLYAGAKGYNDAFNEARRQIDDYQSRDAEEQKRKAQQQVELDTSFDKVLGDLRSEVERLMGLKEELVTAQADLQTQKQLVLDAWESSSPQLKDFEAKRAKALAKIQELQVLIANTVGVNDQMVSRREEAKQALEAAQDAQRTLAATADDASLQYASLDAQTTEAWNLRQQLDQGVEALRKRIAKLQGAYDPDNVEVKSAFGLLLDKLRPITDVTAVDILQPRRDGDDAALRARKREENAQKSLDDLPPIPDLPEARPPDAAATASPASRPPAPIVRRPRRMPPPVRVPRVSPRASSKVRVPSVIGRSYLEAVKMLHDPRVGLELRTLPGPKDLRRGKVIAQSPKGGTLVPKGQKVTVVFSSPPARSRVPTGTAVTRRPAAPITRQPRAPANAMVKVPPLKGMALQNARILLHRAQLLYTPGLGPQEDGGSIVTSTDPPAGRLVPGGHFVQVNVKRR